MSLLNNLEIEEIITKNKPNSSSFIFRHLPPTMGITLGNSLRRILLGHISGIAPLGVEISDKNGPVKSKDTILAGVDKVTRYLIMSLKEIILEEKNKKEGIFCLELNIENQKKEERIIVAGDFQPDPSVEIKNPEFPLATLAPLASLKIKLYCQKNWGYHEEETQKKDYFAEKENVIVLATDYSPIKGGQVNFQVEQEVIGLDKQEEKLTITINTNGAIKPKKALQEALEISQNSFELINKTLTNGRKKGKMAKELATK
ncbi:9584_t:CDS:1 [Entrophospora sp. SA101]|nr:1072_t:CDS:1 [Entrophospora sp. SA101]CAJ0749254.1 9584_t:CDS:1 [Entrophospora sp. SA101]CAJ0829055.1 7920_t:CDS:1 [Entrophospora sp. SA101]CAJ0919091.1 480_t:CDS:1 [Entrophospora sp. SA101]